MMVRRVDRHAAALKDLASRRRRIDEMTDEMWETADRARVESGCLMVDIAEAVGVDARTVRPNIRALHQDKDTVNDPAGR